MKKIALALLAFVLAVVSWAGLYIFFFSVIGKEGYVAVIATYGVLSILFLTKVVYDSVQPPEKVRMMGKPARAGASLLLASAMWVVLLLFCLAWASDVTSLYDNYSLAPFAIIVLLPAVFLAKVFYDALTKGLDSSTLSYPATLRPA